MKYKVEIDKRAEKDFNSLDNPIKKQVMEFFDKLERAENPKARGKRLTGNLAGCWSYRIGDYRIGAEIQDNKLRILVIAIGHREKIYKKLGERFKDHNL